jgi:D-alanyl-D-alanine carboxypeptidase
MRQQRIAVAFLAALGAAGFLAAAAPAAPASLRTAAHARAVAAGSATGRAVRAGSATALQAALNRLVAMPAGPAGVIAIVQRGSSRTAYRAGTADLARPRPMSIWEHARLASFSKAFSGAVTLSLVSQGRLQLASTIGRILPGLPRGWHRVSLSELLQHRSGLPDYTASRGFSRYFLRTPRRPVLPRRLLRWVWHDPLQFRPGSRYRYDNTDNLVAAMMARAVTHRSYRALLRRLVFQPAGLRQTTLPAGPRLPRPFLHGYAPVPGHPPQDVSESFAAALAWASGGLVATAADTNEFIRSYLAGRFFSARVQRAQFRFVPGSSDPPGPGANAAGLAVFRYRTSCGTVYGHTGTAPGYTQFGAASRDGADSVTVTATEQLAPHALPAVLAALRRAELLAVCAAVAPAARHRH